MFFLVKLKGHSPVDLIINNRKRIEKVFAVLFVLSLLFAPMVGVNYDLTEYLPDSSPSAQALDIMEAGVYLPRYGACDAGGCDPVRGESHQGPHRGRGRRGHGDVVRHLDQHLRLEPVHRLRAISRITTKTADAYMDVSSSWKRTRPSRTHAAVREIEQIVGDRGLVAGSAVSDTNLGPTINAEVARVMVLAVIIIFLILTLTTTSWFEPVLFLSVLGIAIVINMGSEHHFRGNLFPVQRGRRGAAARLLDGLFDLPAARFHRGKGQRRRARTGHGQRAAQRLFLDRRLGRDDHCRLSRAGAHAVRHWAGYGLCAGKGHFPQPGHRAAAHAGAHPAVSGRGSQNPAPPVHPQALAADSANLPIRSASRVIALVLRHHRTLLCRAGHGGLYLRQ